MPLCCTWVCMWRKHNSLEFSGYGWIQHRGSKKFFWAISWFAVSTWMFVGLNHTSAVLFMIKLDSHNIMLQPKRFIKGKKNRCDVVSRHTVHSPLPNNPITPFDHTFIGCSSTTSTDRNQSVIRSILLITILLLLLLIILCSYWQVIQCDIYMQCQNYQFIPNK